MALIAVLWLVAALSIMVGSISASVRQEARSVSGKREAVEALALGDAAIQLALQKLRASDSAPRQWALVPVDFAGSTILCEIVPLTGLIDLNQSDSALLMKALVVAAGLSEPDAAAIAKAIMEVRQQRDSGGRVLRFEAEEDLLRVPGITYDLYARLAPLVTLEGRGSGKVNADAAPYEMLLVLASGDRRVADAIQAKRLAGDVGIDLSSLETGLTDNSSSTRVRITAIVPVGPGKSVHVRRSVDLTAPAADGTPWTTYRLSTRVQAASPEN